MQCEVCWMDTDAIIDCPSCGKSVCEECWCSAGEQDGVELGLCVECDLGLESECA